MKGFLSAKMEKSPLSRVVGWWKSGLDSLKSKILTLKSFMARKKPAWKIFEEEIAEALQGRFVKVYRTGKYADIRTRHLLIEAKWSDKRIRVTAPSMLKTRELGYRHGLYPVLVAGTGVVRVLVLLGADMSSEVDKELRTLVDYWHDKGYDVWVSPLVGGYRGTFGVIPTTGLYGYRQAVEGE